MATALFISDIQERFRDIVIGGSALIDTAKYLIQVWTVLGLPIVVTEQNPDKLGKTVAELEEVLAKVDASLLLKEEKSQFSMVSPKVVHFLGDNGVGSAVIVGLETHICVLQTASDLVDNRIRTYVVADGVTSQREFDRSIGLKAAETSGAHLTTAESIVFQVLKDAADPRFRAVAALNKARSAHLSASEAARALSHL